MPLLIVGIKWAHKTINGGVMGIQGRAKSKNY
jgi:hypothetical protein